MKNLWQTWKTHDTDEEEQKQEEFVPVNEEGMTPESDEFIPQENEAVEW